MRPLLAVARARASGGSARRRPRRPPSLNAIARAIASAEAFYDWGGGLIWLSLDAERSGAGWRRGSVRAAMAQAGGHATLVVAPDAVRAAVPVFEPLQARARPLSASGSRAASTRAASSIPAACTRVSNHHADELYRRPARRIPISASPRRSCASCVHCGFCTATCPTYVLLGDELDSPRGRIYLIKDMLENDRPATEEVVKHIDRCLSCLSCMTTCPSGVNYMHLVDHARHHIEKTYRRPWLDRAFAPSARLRPAAAPPVPRGAQRVARLGQAVRPTARRIRCGRRWLWPRRMCRRPRLSIGRRFSRAPDADPAGGAAERLRPAGPGARRSTRRRSVS